VQTTDNLPAIVKRKEKRNQSKLKNSRSRTMLNKILILLALWPSQSSCNCKFGLVVEGETTTFTQPQDLIHAQILLKTSQPTAVEVATEQTSIENKIAEIKVMHVWAVNAKLTQYKEEELPKLVAAFKKLAPELEKQRKYGTTMTDGDSGKIWPENPNCSIIADNDLLLPNIIQISSILTEGKIGLQVYETKINPTIAANKAVLTPTEKTKLANFALSILKKLRAEIDSCHLIIRTKILVAEMLENRIFPPEMLAALGDNLCVPQNKMEHHSIRTCSVTNDGNLRCLVEITQTSSATLVHYIHAVPVYIDDNLVSVDLGDADLVRRPNTALVASLELCHKQIDHFHCEKEFQFRPNACVEMAFSATSIAAILKACRVKTLQEQDQPFIVTTETGTVVGQRSHRPVVLSSNGITDGLQHNPVYVKHKNALSVFFLDEHSTIEGKDITLSDVCELQLTDKDLLRFAASRSRLPKSLFSLKQFFSESTKERFWIVSLILQGVFGTIFLVQLATGCMKYCRKCSSGRDSQQKRVTVSSWRLRRPWKSVPLANAPANNRENQEFTAMIKRNPIPTTKK
jgi:hypothetical protein